MTDSHNHNEMGSHVSEQLLAYARDELGGDEALFVREHLEACSECRGELDAVRALISGHEEELTEIERARLHDAVSRRTRPAARPPRRWGGIAAGLGAAALVILGVVLSAHVGSGGGGGAASSEMNAPVVASPATTNDQISNQGAAAAGAKAPAVRPSPSFAHSPSAATSLSALRAEGAEGPLFRAFAGYYDSTDASRLHSALTDQLAAEAPTKALSSQIRRCANTVLGNDNHPALPAYAADTSIEDRPALVLGFAWTPDASGPLDHYMFWAWPRRECGVPLTYETGDVKP